MGQKNKKKKTSVGSILCIILLILMIPVLIVNVVILISSWVKPDEIPGFMGYKPFIVLSGSMEPTIMTGDLAISKKVNDTSELKVGDIISFRIENNIIVTHRIVEITKIDGKIAFITKGDNNYENDQNPVKAEKVEGVYVTKINGMGNVAMFMQEPKGFVIAAAIPVLVIVITQIYSSNKYKKELQELKQKIDKN